MKKYPWDLLYFNGKFQFYEKDKQKLKWKFWVFDPYILKWFRHRIKKKIHQHFFWPKIWLKFSTGCQNQKNKLFNPAPVLSLTPLWSGERRCKLRRLKKTTFPNTTEGLQRTLVPARRFMDRPGKIRFTCSICIYLDSHTFIIKLVTK